MENQKIIRYWVTHEYYTREEFKIIKDRKSTYVCTLPVNELYEHSSHVRKKEMYEDGDVIPESRNIWVYVKDEEKFKEQLILFYLGKQKNIIKMMNRLKGIESNET